MADNIIDIEGFEKYGPALNSNIATFSTPTANLMNVHNNVTLMRNQSFTQEWLSVGGSTGSAIGIITGRAGGSSKAMAIADGSGNVTAASRMINGNYARTIVGLAMVSNLGSKVAITFWEIAGNGAQLTLYIDNLGKLNLARGNINGGTILFTSNALFLANVWHYVEIDFTIHNTAGAYTIWCDGVQITTASGVNTRGIGSNNFWNAIIPQCFSATGAFDDMYIRDNTNGTALPFGDSTIDGLPMTANSTAQFSPAVCVLGTRYNQECVQTNAPGAGQLALVAVTPAVNMTVNSIGCLPQAGVLAAKYKGVIYSDSAGAPGSLLSSGIEVVGSLGGQVLTMPLVTPQALTGGTQYWIGFITDTSVVLQQSDNFSSVGQKKANTYASGAPAGPLSGMTTGQPTWSFWGNCVTGSNYDIVNKIPSAIMNSVPIGYTSSSTPAQMDLYTAASLANPPPNQIYSVKVSVLAQRSDSGPRTMNIHAGTGTGTRPGITPATSMQWYSSRFDTDPATGGPWGPGGVNATKYGYEVAT